MRYRKIPSSLFVNNRRRFVESLPPGALFVIHANDVPQTNGDVTRSFIQNSNLFWLTGIDQEETTLLLFPDSPVADYREILFIRETNSHLVIWEGNKLTKSEATETSGIQCVHWSSSFDALFRKLMAQTELVFLAADQHPGKIPGPLDRNQRFVQWCREQYPLHQYHNAFQVFQSLRVIKDPEEIELMRHASGISHAAFLSACGVIRPGVYEYAIEAEFAREIIRRGGRGFAYEPIIASGEQSCVLHYIANDRECADGDVLLMDVGASYANYSADMTRTVPVNGHFTTRQRAVYNAVLGILKEAVPLIRKGHSLADYHSAVDQIADKALCDLGLISINELKTQDSKHPIRSRYFLHRTAHFIGLDVHDMGDPYQPLDQGMVLTCEPGIYIREEGLGIRLENNILITADGNEDFMSEVPIEAEEIESLLAK